MKATVTISLEELESLKEEIKILENKNIKLNKQKNFNLSIDGDIYDWKDGKRFYSSRLIVYGDIKLLTEKAYLEFQKEVKELFDKMIENSRYMKFYKIFPKWIHKLFKC